MLMSCSMLHALHRMRSEVAAPGHLLNVALVSSSKVPLLLRFPFACFRQERAQSVAVRRVGITCYLEERSINSHCSGTPA